MIHIDKEQNWEYRVEIRNAMQACTLLSSSPGSRRRHTTLYSVMNGECRYSESRKCYSVHRQTEDRETQQREVTEDEWVQTRTSSTSEQQ